ncbi:MAG: hypothetical protein Q9199_007941 [Rusavskia elegans]
MASLSISETKFRISNVHKAYKATFHWLFDPNVVPFSHWLSRGTETTESFFWIQGKPGSGKSTLMKFAMKDSRTLALLGEISDSEPQWTLVAFFFHDRGSSIQKSLLGLLREVVDSTLRQLPQLMSHAIAVYRDLVKSQRNKLPDWHFEALRNVMQRITGQRETRVKLLLFLDALDEHEGDKDLLLQLLKEWTQNVDGYYVTLKICLASRSWPVFSQQFEVGPNFVIDQFTKEDIRIFTESRLSSSHVGSVPLLELESLGYLIEQITTKARGVFIWVRLVTDRLAKNIRDGTPFQVLSRIIADTPEELQELYDDTLRRINAQYANETHVMFQMVLCSVGRLPLETLVEATVMCLNRYLDDNSCLDSESSSKNSAFPQALRWLISRSGGLLETYTAEPNIDHLGEPGTPLQYVQFLHQTSKEYIQSHRAQAFMKRAAPQVAGKNGYYFLSLASQSCSAWVAPIKIQMLYYIKLTELHDQIDEHIMIPFDDGSSTVTHANHPCGFKWWLQQQENPSLKSLYHIIFSPVIDPDHRSFYGQICLVVTANLISMVPKAYPPELQQYLSVGAYQVGSICLLQTAIGGGNAVPAELQDRTAMVVKLLALGYSPSTRRAIPYHLAVWPDMEDPGHTFLKAGSEGKRESTPIEYLLHGFGNVRLTQETRISILDALIDAGAKVDPLLVSYCAQYENAAILRVLLRRGAPINERDHAGWLPIDYALLRGDREILAAFNDFLSEPLGPDLRSNSVAPPLANTSETLILLSTTVYTACGHPGLAMLLARCENQEHRLRLKKELEQRQYEAKLDRQRSSQGPV